MLAGIRTRAAWLAVWHYPLCHRVSLDKFSTKYIAEDILFESNFRTNVSAHTTARMLYAYNSSQKYVNLRNIKYSNFLNIEKIHKHTLLLQRW